MLYWFLPYNHTIMSPLIIMRSHNYVSPPTPPITILIVICLGVCLFGFILFGTFWASWIWISAFFPILGKCSSTFSSFNFSGSSSVYSPSRSPIMWILLHLMQSQMSHHVKILFSFFCSVWVSYIYFVFQLTDAFFYLIHSAFEPF